MAKRIHKKQRSRQYTKKVARSAKRTHENLIMLYSRDKNKAMGLLDKLASEKKSYSKEKSIMVFKFIKKGIESEDKLMKKVNAINSELNLLFSQKTVAHENQLALLKKARILLKRKLVLIDLYESGLLFGQIRKEFSKSRKQVIADLKELNQEISELEHNF